MSNDEENNLQEITSIKDVDFEELYKIRFKKIENFLIKHNIEIPNEIVDKNQLIDFVKKSNIDPNILDKFIKSDINYKIDKRIIYPISSLFKKISKSFSSIIPKKKIKEDEEKSTHQSAETNKQFLDEEGKEKKKRKFRFPSSLLIISGILFLFIILTWIPHTPYVDESGGSDWIWNYIVSNGGESVVSDGRFGLVDSTYAVVGGFAQALTLFMYLFALGALIQILMDTNSFERGIGSTLKGLENKKSYSIPLLFIMFSAFGTIWGMQEEAIPYYTILIPFMILSGFTPITALMILLLANTTGMMASVTNPFSPGVAINSLGEQWEGLITMGSGIITRFIVWIILTAAGAAFVTWYAVKHSEKEDPDYYNDQKGKYIDKIGSDMIQEDYQFKTMRTVDKVSLSVFGITILVIVLGVIPWQTWFPNFGVSESGTVHHGFFGSFISNFFTVPGLWGFVDLTTVVVIGIIAQILIHGVRKYEWSNIIMEGAKGMLGVSIIIGIARGASIVLTYSGLSLVIVNGLSHIPGQDTNYGFLMFVFVASISLGTIIPSTSGSAGILFPIIGELREPIQANVQLMSSSVLVFAMCLGITNMFTPAQAVLLVSVEKAGVSYGEYIKRVWGFILMQLLIMLIFIIPILSLL